MRDYWLNQNTIAQIQVCRDHNLLNKRAKDGEKMASSKEYLDFVLEQLSGLDEIAYKAMMGEYIIYYRGKLSEESMMIVSLSSRYSQQKL